MPAARAAWRVNLPSRVFMPGCCAGTPMRPNWAKSMPMCATARASNRPMGIGTVRCSRAPLPRRRFCASVFSPMWTGHWPSSRPSSTRYCSSAVSSWCITSRSLTGSPSTRLWNLPSRLAEQTAIASSTACSTSWRPKSAQPKSRRPSATDPFGAIMSADSEFDLIARYFDRPVPPGMLGVGDDCALLPLSPGCELAVSTDMLVQGQHFLSDVDPRSLGHKALAVNLSDLAAMGARPLACTLALSLPGIDHPWLQGFSDGFHALAEKSRCPLVGGDTTHNPDGIVISVTVMGEVRRAHALRRSGAREGDDIWLSGSLGAAYVALLLRQGYLPADAARLQ